MRMMGYWFASVRMMDLLVCTFPICWMGHVGTTVFSDVRFAVFRVKLTKSRSVLAKRYRRLVSPKIY